jgi:predicted Zn-dependent protease
MSCIVYMVTWNCTTHATYLLTLTTYKYSELQVSSITQKSSCKANCKKKKKSHKGDILSSTFAKGLDINWAQGLIIQSCQNFYQNL